MATVTSISDDMKNFYPNTDDSDKNITYGDRMKMKSAVIILAALALFPVRGETQGPLKSFVNDGGVTGYLNLGANSVMVRNLNSNFEKNGIPTVSNMFYSMGGGSRIFLGDKYVIGFDYIRLMRQRESNGRYFSRLSGSTNSVSFGYIVYQREKINVYPSIGIGMQHLDVKVYDDSNFSFDTLMNDPKMGSEMSMRGLLLDIGVQFDLYSLKGKRKMYCTGIKAGYCVTVAGGYWSMAGQKVSGGPAAGMDGAYIQINLGVRDLMREIFGEKFAR